MMHVETTQRAISKYTSALSWPVKKVSGRQLIDNKLYSIKM